MERISICAGCMKDLARVPLVEIVVSYKGSEVSNEIVELCWHKACYQPALVAVLRDLVEYCDRRLFQSVHITQEPPEMQAARVALAGVASGGGE